MKMADCAVQALRSSLLAVTDYTPALAEQVRADEEATDHYEDILGTVSGEAQQPDPDGGGQ